MQTLSAHNVASVDRKALFHAHLQQNLVSHTLLSHALTIFSRGRSPYFGGQTTLAVHELWRFTTDSDLLLMGLK